MPRYIDVAGLVSTEVVGLVEEKADHRGFLPISTLSGTVFIHPKRLLPDDAPSGVVVGLETYGSISAMCPKCREISTLTPVSKVGRCSEHGEYSVYLVGKSQMAVANDDDRVSDLANIRSYGELWTKANLEFDHPNCDAKAHALLIPGDLATGTQDRKLCFNTYSGTLGKRAKGLELEAFVKGEAGKNGKPLGYAIKDSLEAERERLINKHYKRDN